MAPTVAEYLAATQLVQTVEAVDAEYLPAPQLTQVEAVVASTAAENLPATPLVQTVETVDAEYLLVTQLGVVVGRGGVGSGGVGRGGVMRSTAWRMVLAKGLYCSLPVGGNLLPIRKARSLIVPMRRSAGGPDRCLETNISLTKSLTRPSLSCDTKSAGLTQGKRL